MGSEWRSRVGMALAPHEELKVDSQERPFPSGLVSRTDRCRRGFIRQGTVLPERAIPQQPRPGAVGAWRGLIERDQYEWRLAGIVRGPVQLAVTSPARRP